MKQRLRALVTVLMVTVLLHVALVSFALYLANN